MEEEKILVIDKIRIENFMSIAKKEIEFSKNFNEFVGFNGVGKTTVLSAINWCLFGKDYYDKSQFDIFPIIEGKVRKELKPHIEVDVIFGSEKYTITRSIVGDKDLTQLEVNGLKVKKNSEYPTFLKEKLNINDEEFKMLSNINYAINLPQNDLRNLIVNLIGDISDVEMFTHEEIENKYSSIKNKVIEVGTEELKQNITTSKKNRNTELLKTIGAIEQEESNIQKFNFDDKYIENIKKRRDELFEINDNYSKKVDIENKKRSDINNLKLEISKKENECQRLKNEFDAKNRDGVAIKEKINRITNIDNMRNNDIHKIELEIQNIDFEIESTDNHINNLKTQKQNIVNEFNSLKGLEIVVENTVCESCGQELPKEKINEILEFKKKSHDNKLQSLKDENDKYKEMIENEEKHIVYIKSEKERKMAKIKELETKDYSQEIMSNQEVNSLNIEIQNKRNECIEIKGKIQEISKSIVLLKQQLERLPLPLDVPSINNIKLELENINKNLANYEVLNEHKGNLEKLKEKKEKLDKDIILLNHMEMLLKDYKTTKSEMMTKKLESKFKLISFKTKEINKSGNIIDCFKVTMNGKDFVSLSGGEKMRASIDMVCGIQELKQKKIPLLIDCMGELDEFPEFVNTQVISCRAMQKIKETHPKYNEYMTTYNKLQMIKR
jgi:DNA repair exonuclease SbcCD ATPase subunit